MYNAYLCVKYGIRIKGIGADDLALAKEFMEKSGEHIHKIVELPFVIESDSFDTVAEGSWRKRAIKDLTAGMELNFVLDTDPESFAEEQVRQVFAGAGTIFINAVMGYTVLFKEGTKAAYQLIDANAEALKLFGGGDTIQEFKDLLSDVFGKAVNNERYYFFTGGGAILDAIEKGSPYAMKPVQVLIENAGM
ncbi:MAG: phosphoglycerate kinase [Candidatus Cloacimonetes bacterium]|nr:phosphoglycerate kinase [Candidatus Cloacimonadota bacterium]